MEASDNTSNLDLPTLLISNVELLPENKSEFFTKEEFMEMQSSMWCLELYIAQVWTLIITAVQLLLITMHFTSD
jgi:hypothetical protein